MNVQELFDHVQQLASHVIKKSPDIDYQTIIENITLITADENIRFSCWAERVMPNGLLYENITRKVLPLVEKTVNGYGEERCLHRNHFMIEIFRTPTQQSSPDLCALLKIAVYLGFIRHNLRDSEFPEGVVRLFRDFKAWALINFIEEGRAVKVSEELVEEINDILSNA